jgi:uncharacterized protein involved in outer membrane biogenesis
MNTMENKKKGMLRKILKWSGIGFVVLLTIIIALPFLFKDKIQQMVIDEANKTLLADLSLGEFDLTFLSSFPNMTVELTDTKIIGRDEFKGLALIDAKTIKAQVKLWDVISGDQIAIRGIYLEDANINVKVLQSGKANYDITVPDTAAVVVDEEPSNFKMSLEKYVLTNCDIVYDDQDGDMYAKITGLNHEGSGDMTADVIDFETVTSMNELTYDMEGMSYLSKVKTNIVMNILMEFTEKTSKFTLRENTFELNNLKFALDGFYEMLENEDNMDLKLDASKATFKDFLSLIPTFYQSGYESMVTKGNLAMNGFVKGKMSDTDMPGWDFKLMVDGASIKYPDMPGTIDHIVLKAGSKFAGGADMDKMTLDVEKFHADFVGNTLDASLKMRNPMTDPLIVSSIKAKVDLATLKKVMPMAEGENYVGKLDADITLDGRLSAIEQERYEDFQALGTLVLKGMEYQSPELPQQVDISEMTFIFSPKNLNLASMSAKMGKSDFSMNGTIDNYLAYAFKDELLKGSFNFSSANLDLDDLMPASEAAPETTTTNATTESTDDEPILIPGNIDFTLNTNIGNMRYDGLDIKNVGGKVRIKDQVAYLDGLSMNAMGGSVGMTGAYNTTNHDKPSIDFTYDLKNIEVQELTKYFTSIETMAPVAKYAKGSFSSSFKMKGDLMPNLDPVYNSLTGNGDFFTSKMVIEGFKPMEKIGESLKMDNLKKQTIQELKAFFSFADGKVTTKPFNMKMGKIPTTVSGYTTFDQDIDYSMLMNIPKSEIPASMIKLAEDGINKLNSLTPGLNVSGLPAVIPVNVKIGGKVTDPKVSTDFKEALMKASGNVKDDLMNKVNEIKDKAVDSVKAVVGNKINEVKENLQAKKDQIMREAQVQADKVKAETKNAANTVRREGDASAKKLMDAAGSNPIKKKAAEIAGNKLKNEAEEKAQKIESEGNKKADDIMAAAKKKADGL